MPLLIHRLAAHKLALVILLCIAARVAALVALPGVFDFVSTGAIHGSGAYDTYATNLLSTGVYGLTPGAPDAMLAPLYSYVLAVVYGIFGRGYWQVGLFHTLLDAASIALLYLIGKKLFDRWGEWVGWLACVFYAIYPYLIFQNLTLIDTPLFMLELHAFVLIAILLRERPRRDRVTWGLAILGGLVLGLSMLTRPILPPLAALAARFDPAAAAGGGGGRAGAGAVDRAQSGRVWRIRADDHHQRLQLLSGQQPRHDPLPAGGLRRAVDES
jgi:4-amino-4-deoxy-L-arabinose transferase-like glycosyltransferase